MHSGMICHVMCLKAGMAEGEFSMGRRRSKPQGGKVQAGEFQFAVPVLQMPPEDVQGKNCSNKLLFDPPLLFGKGCVVKEGSLMSFSPSKGMFLLWFQGAGTLLLVLCRLAEQQKQGHVSSEFIILKSREGREERLYLCISLLCY